MSGTHHRHASGWAGGWVWKWLGRPTSQSVFPGRWCAGLTCFQGLEGKGDLYVDVVGSSCEALPYMGAFAPVGAAVRAVARKRTRPRVTSCRLNPLHLCVGLLGESLGGYMLMLWRWSSAAMGGCI